MTAATRWADALAAWAIPDEILAEAPESPWGFPSPVFAEAATSALTEPLTVSHHRALRCAAGGGRRARCRRGRRSGEPSAGSARRVDRRRRYEPRDAHGVAHARCRTSSERHGPWPLARRRANRACCRRGRVRARGVQRRRPRRLRRRLDGPCRAGASCSSSRPPIRSRRCRRCGSTSGACRVPAHRPRTMRPR